MLIFPFFLSFYFLLIYFIAKIAYFLIIDLENYINCGNETSKSAYSDSFCKPWNVLLWLLGYSVILIKGFIFNGPEKNADFVLNISDVNNVLKLKFWGS